MRNDFKIDCMGRVCDILDTQKSTEKIRIFSKGLLQAPFFISYFENITHPL